MKNQISLPFDDLTLNLGYKCNYSCAHCINESHSSNFFGELSQEELSNIIETSIRYKPKILTFVGGEPTLYIDTINYIYNKIIKHYTPVISLVSNGWYGFSYEKTESVLGKINGLKKLVLSYDVFHESKTSLEHIQNVEKYCINSKIIFHIQMAISEPIDLIKANEITKSIKSRIDFKKVVRGGRAKKNDCHFKYSKFDDSVLLNKCPSKGQIVFIPKKGFSTCCSILGFSSEKTFVTNYDLDKYLESDFYLDTKDLSFRDLIQKYNPALSNFKPDDSEECNLCAKIFSNDGD